MKVAELFVQLGLSGQGDVSKGLGTVSSSLKELFSMSIRTKLTLAGIVGCLTGAAISAGKTGMELSKFNRTFGLSTDILQRWQQGGEQFGVTADEIAESIGSVQDALAKTKVTGEYNEAFGRLMIDPEKMKNAFDVMNTLRQRIQSGQIDAARVLSSSLISQNMFQMLRGIGDVEKMKPQRAILSEKEIQAGAKMDVAFTRFGKDLNRQMESFVIEKQPLIMEVLKDVKMVIKELLEFLRNTVKNSGVLKDVSEGKSLPEVAANATVRTGAQIGQDMVDATWEGMKSAFSFFQSSAQNSEAERILREAPTKEQALNMKKAVVPKAPTAAEVPMTEIQQDKKTSVFYFNGAEFTDELKHETRQDFQRVAIHKMVSVGRK